VSVTGQSILDPLDTLVLGISPVPVQLKSGQQREVLLNRLGENVDRPRVHLSVLQLERPKLGVGTLLESGSERDTSLGAQQAVGEVERAKFWPRWQRGRDRTGSGFGTGVVLQVEGLELGTLAQPLSERVDTFHSDPVLRKANLDQVAMSGKGFGKVRRRAVLQPVPSTDNRLQVGLLSGSLRLLCILEESLGDDGASPDTETVVVQLENLEVAVIFEEGHHGVCAPSSKGIVREVQLDQRGMRLQSIADGREGGGNFADQTPGEDVCKVRDLR
jgi:hypothetical protein